MGDESIKIEEVVVVPPKTEKSDEIQKKEELKESHPSDTKPWLFKPGQSGNPEGKPKGIKHFKTVYTEVMKEIGAKNQRGEDITNDLVIVKKLFDKAKNGDLKAIDMIVSRVDGDKDDAAPLLQVNVIALTQEQQEALQNLL